MGVTNFDVVQANDFIGANFPTQGKKFYVRPNGGSDGNDGRSPKRACKTLAQALALATANQNDVIYLMAESNTAANTTDYQSALLDWNKDLVHLIGVNAGGMMGQRSRIAPLSTATSFTNLFKVSANGCRIQNVAFYQGVGSTNPAASTCVLVTGDRNHFVNCQISGIGEATLDDAGANDLTVQGSENVFDDCYIGLDTVIRATCVTGVILSGTPARTVFRNCFFDVWTSSTSYIQVTIPTGADRFVYFKDCVFNATLIAAGSAVPLGALSVTTLNGSVLLDNPKLFGHANYAAADNTYIKIIGHNSTGAAAGKLIGMSQSLDIA